MTKLATLTTSKPVNIDQLAAELGAAITVSTSGETVVIVCEDPTVTDATLADAVQAHDPIDNGPAPTPATRDDVANLQSQLDEVVDLILEGLL